MKEVGTQLSLGPAPTHWHQLCAMRADLIAGHKAQKMPSIQQATWLWTCWRAGWNSLSSHKRECGGTWPLIMAQGSPPRPAWCDAWLRGGARSSAGLITLPSHPPIGQDQRSPHHQPAARDQPQDPSETVGEGRSPPHVQPGGGDETTTSPGKKERDSIVAGCRPHKPDTEVQILFPLSTRKAS